MEIMTTLLFFAIGFCIIMYVLLDGFDLGVGILFPLFPGANDRNILMSTILPVWDGNQTWLVLGGALLYGAFPLAFSLILPALYAPIFVMILALLIRGITFEFRLKAKRALRLWDSLFFLSSLVVAFTQGMVLGTFVKGYTIEPGNLVLHSQLFTFFNVSCGFALIFGYALLGSTWVIGKTSGELQERMYKFAKISIWVVAVSLMIISIWTPFIDPKINEIWFNPQNIYKLAVLPFVTACLILYFLYSLYKRYQYRLFWLVLGVFMCSYSGFGISTWPYIVPRVLTATDAAAPHSTQAFLIVGVIILLPILFGYTMYSYYIFRGKITKIIGYD